MSKHSISVNQDNLLHHIRHEPLGLCRWEQGGREEAINSLAGVGNGPDLGWGSGSHEGQSEGLGTGLLWLASRPTLFPLFRYWKEHSDKQPLVQMLIVNCYRSTNEKNRTYGKIILLLLC